jgi:hypothetical protein
VRSLASHRIYNLVHFHSFIDKVASYIKLLGNFILGIVGVEPCIFKATNSAAQLNSTHLFGDENFQQLEHVLAERRSNCPRPVTDL